MLRLLFVLMALSLASIVQADVSIYIEDFKETFDNSLGQSALTPKISRRCCQSPSLWSRGIKGE